MGRTKVMRQHMTQLIVSVRNEFPKKEKNRKNKERAAKKKQDKKNMKNSYIKKLNIK